MNVIFVGILEKVVDDFNVATWYPALAELILANWQLEATTGTIVPLRRTADRRLAAGYSWNIKKVRLTGV